MVERVVGAYRDNARGLDPRCTAGDHQVEIVRVLRGGEGPDDSTHVVECGRGCGAAGWRFVGDDLDWQEPGGGSRWVCPHRQGWLGVAFMRVRWWMAERRFEKREGGLGS